MICVDSTPIDYPVWTVDQAAAFLLDQCGLEGPLPGLAVERHGEAFGRWGAALSNGKIDAPLTVTHVDAHADLGLGESVHMEIMGELLFEPMAHRAQSATRITDGS